MTLPTIVFIPGAFAHPSCFDSIATLLQRSNYPTTYAPYPSLNPSDPSTASVSTDVSEVRKNFLLPLIEEQGKDVVVFAHSFGGVVAGGAAAGLCKTTRRKRNEEGGVIGLIYLVGGIVGEGERFLDVVGGAYPPFIKEGNPSPGLAVISPVIPTLYADADPALTSTLEAAMIPHALKAFETPAPAPAWKEAAFKGRRAYLRTLDDQCNPLFLQEKWIEGSGVEWDVVDLETSHSAFISRPEEVVERIVGFLEKFERV